MTDLRVIWLIILSRLSVLLNCLSISNLLDDKVDKDINEICKAIKWYVRLFDLKSKRIQFIPYLHLLKKFKELRNIWGYVRVAKAERHTFLCL